MSFEVAALILGGAAIFQGERARRTQKKAIETETRIRGAESARERMQQIRQQMITQAQIQQAASTQGSTQGSAFQGGMASIGSQTAGNIQFINQMDQFTEQMQHHRTKINQYRGNAQTLTALGNLSMKAGRMGSPLSTDSYTPPSFLEGMADRGV